MKIAVKPALAGLALALALTPAAQAQQTPPAEQPPAAAAAEVQPPIVPRKPGVAARQPDQVRQFGGTRRESGDRHARRDRDGHRHFLFFGRHGHHDRDGGRGRSAGQEGPAAPGTVAPPANGLFKNGAAPKAQVD